MALTKKLTAGITAATLLFTGVILTGCNEDVSGTFANTDVTAETSQETKDTEASSSQTKDSAAAVRKIPKDTLFNSYEALSNEQIVMLQALCEPQIGGTDRITWSNEKDFYDSLSPESKKLAAFKDIRYDSSIETKPSYIDVSLIKDAELQKALASYVKDGYTISGKIADNALTYNGERLVGNIFFTNGYHIDRFGQEVSYTGFIVKITDELFQAYVYALSRREILESSLQYDFTVDKKGDVYQVTITSKEMSIIEIEYDTSTGIMTYIIKINNLDTVG